MTSQDKNVVLRFVEYAILSSRWLLVILYLGLGLGLILYSYKFASELEHLFTSINTISSELAMLGLLGLVDITMVANLVIMIMVGGYSIFISEINSSTIKNRPRFMAHITSAGLKIKMGTSLIGVSSIHLLKKFIEVSDNSHEHQMNWTNLSMLLGVHLVFVISTLILAIIDKLGKDPVGEKIHA